MSPHCQWKPDLEICYHTVKEINIDSCIQGERMFFSSVSQLQILHKHLGVPNSKKTGVMELNKGEPQASCSSVVAAHRS